MKGTPVVAMEHRNNVIAWITTYARVYRHGARLVICALGRRSPRSYDSFQGKKAFTHALELLQKQREHPSRTLAATITICVHTSALFYRSLLGPKVYFAAPRVKLVVASVQNVMPVSEATP